MIYLLAAVILLALLLNHLFKTRALDGLSYRLSLGTRTTEAGEPFLVSTVVENRKALPVPFLRVYERLPERLTFCREGEEQRTMTMALRPWERVRRSYEVMAERRGRYLFRGSRLTAGDLLGLSELTGEIDLMEELVVFPPSLDPEAELIPVGSLSGEIPVRRLLFEDPVLTAGFRDYTGREPMKQIHWPVSARTGKLMVKEFEFTTDRTARVLLSIDCWDHGFATVDTEAVEWSFSICRGVLELLEEAAVPYSVQSNADSFPRRGAPEGLGPKHLEEVLELMGRSACYRSHSFSELLEAETDRGMGGESLIVIASKLAGDWMDALTFLSARYERLSVITCDPGGSDCAFPEGVRLFIRRVCDGADFT